MKLYDIVKWDDESAGVNDIVAYKHEAEDFNTHTQLIVHASQEAIFFKDGRALDLFESGKHTLSTQNLPLLGKLVNIPTGGQTPFHCEVYFINKVYFNDLRWGTPSPIQIEDPIEGVNIHVGANGLFGAHIQDSRKFLIKIVGTRKTFSKTELSEYLRGKIIERITDLLAKTMVDKKIGILSVGTHFRELSDDIMGQMTPFFEDYGIAIDNFSFNAIKAPDEDLQAINESKIKARKMDMESEALQRKRAREGYTYQQERGFDVLGSAASNEGTSGTFMGAGMGLGLGLGVGGAFGTPMGNIAREGFSGMNNTQNSNTNANQNVNTQRCPNCGNPISIGVKFCGNCGAKLGKTCPKCGAWQTDGKFCNNCGAPLSRVCPKCGAEIPDGAKFCNNCGEKV